jgi:hypothetical protein
MYVVRDSLESAALTAAVQHVSDAEAQAIRDDDTWRWPVRSGMHRLLHMLEAALQLLRASRARLNDVIATLPADTGLLAPKDISQTK